MQGFRGKAKCVVDMVAERGREVGRERGEGGQCMCVWATWPQRGSKWDTDTHRGRDPSRCAAVLALVTRLVTQTWRLRSGRTKKVNEPPAFTQVSKGNSEEEVGGGTGGFFVTQADTE